MFEEKIESHAIAGEGDFPDITSDLLDSTSAINFDDTELENWFSITAAYEKALQNKSHRNLIVFSLKLASFIALAWVTAKPSSDCAKAYANDLLDHLGLDDDVLKDVLAEVAAAASFISNLALYTESYFDFWDFFKESFSYLKDKIKNITTIIGDLKNNSLRHAIFCMASPAVMSYIILSATLAAGGQAYLFYLGMKDDIDNDASYKSLIFKFLLDLGLTDEIYEYLMLTLMFAANIPLFIMYAVYLKKTFQTPMQQAKFERALERLENIIIDQLPEAQRRLLTEMFDALPVHRSATIKNQLARLSDDAVLQLKTDVRFVENLELSDEDFLKLVKSLMSKFGIEVESPAYTKFLMATYFLMGGAMVFAGSFFATYFAQQDSLAILANALYSTFFEVNTDNAARITAKIFTFVPYTTDFSIFVASQIMVVKKLMNLPSNIYHLGRQLCDRQRSAKQPYDEIFASVTTVVCSGAILALAGLCYAGDTVAYIHDKVGYYALFTFVLTALAYYSASATNALAFFNLLSTILGGLFCAVSACLGFTSKETYRPYEGLGKLVSDARSRVKNPDLSEGAKRVVDEFVSDGERVNEEMKLLPGATRERRFCVIV